MCWICPICSSSNDNSLRCCFVCGYKKERKHVPYEDITSSYDQGCDYYNNGSFDIAFKLLLFAAEHKYVPALLKIAECYRRGQGTKPCEQKAYEAYLRAAKCNNATSQYELAKCFYYGYGTSKNLSKAVFWLEKAVEQDDLSSIKMLANMMLNGEGAPQDTNKALELYEKAKRICVKADKKVDADIILGIGCCFQLNKQRFKAVHCYKQAAMADNEQAQYMLALCYLNGRGVFKSINKAKKWLQISAEKGYLKSREKLNELI